MENQTIKTAYTYADGNVLRNSSSTRIRFA